MTEQEIIEYLKKNKKEGRILAFMPEEVRKWCEEHICEEHIKELLVWQSHRWYDAEDICTDDVVTLPDNYKVKKEPKGRWVEFEINEGKFNFVPSDVNGLDGVIESWWNWQEFLTVSSKFNLGFTAFGGWQYEGSKRWYLAPAVKSQYDDYWNSYVIEQSGEATPAIPIKIRFWREEK